MKSATRLTSKGQVVIPKPVRERLRWKPGVRLQVEDCADGSIRLRPDEEDAIDEAAGFLTEGDPLADLEAEHRAEVEADERWRRRRR